MIYRYFMPALVTILAVVIGAHAADRYPSRTVRLIVAFAPGGVADIMGRFVAQALQSRIGQSVIVENKPGGDGLIGMGEVVRATPDGYTLLVGGFGGQIIPPLMRDDSAGGLASALGVAGLAWAGVVLLGTLPAALRKPTLVDRLTRTRVLVDVR